HARQVTRTRPDARHHAAAYDADDPRREEAVALAVDDVRPERRSLEPALGRRPYRRFSQPLAAGVEVVLGDRLKREIFGTPLGLRSIVRETAVDGDGGDVHEPRPGGPRGERGEARAADVDRLVFLPAGTLLQQRGRVHQAADPPLERRAPHGGVLHVARYRLRAESLDHRAARGA